MNVGRGLLHRAAKVDIVVAVEPRRQPGLRQTSVAPSDCASSMLHHLGDAQEIPRSARCSRENAQKPQCLMQTFVKLMLRFTTYVTMSPT